MPVGEQPTARPGHSKASPRCCRAGAKAQFRAWIAYLIEPPPEPGPELPVYLRVAASGDAIYLDLCDDGWNVVEITADGWRVTNDVPVRFRRKRGMLALPRPEPGGTLDELHQFVNVASEADWRLLIAWLLAAMLPDGPYPVLVLHTEEPGVTAATLPQRHRPAEEVKRLALTPKEAACSLGVSVDHFERHIQPELAIAYVGRHRLIPVADLERWLRATAVRGAGR